MSTSILWLRSARPPIARSRLGQKTRGSITVFAAAAIVLLLLMAAFAIDLGMICVATAEMQRSADAAALAATEELLKQVALQPGQARPMDASMSSAVQEAAISVAGLNEVGRRAPDVRQNPTNDKEGEIVIGELTRSEDGKTSLAFQDSTRFNSVAVRVKRTADSNGEVSLFFGQILGRNGVGAEAQAQAAFLQDFNGFRVPSGDDPPPTLLILPFALDYTTLRKAQFGIGPDDYGWDPATQSVNPRRDGIPEVSLFPLDTGAGGNFGTVDIGSNNSNTPTLRRQIVNGVTREDLRFHGGELVLNERGELILSGDPGQKLGAIEPELRKIIGQTRIIPLYSKVSGAGNKAEFTIVSFAAVRILAAELTGSTRFVKIQPAAMITRGGIPGRNGTIGIFSPVILVH